MKIAQRGEGGRAAHTFDLASIILASIDQVCPQAEKLLFIPDY